MITKILRVHITCEVMFINDDGEVETMIQTQPLTVYKGQKFNYEQYLGIVENSALQGYQNQRPSGD